MRGLIKKGGERRLMHYERVRWDLVQAENTIKMELKSTSDSETEKRALEESLELIRQAAEKCRLAQAEAVRAAFSQGMNME